VRPHGRTGSTSGPFDQPALSFRYLVLSIRNGWWRLKLTPSCSSCTSALGRKQTLQKGLSALAPKADMCGALDYVCYGPEADSCIATNGLFDHLVANLQKCVSKWQPERFGLLDIDDKIKLIRRLCGQIASRLTLEDTINI